MLFQLGKPSFKKENLLEFNLPTHIYEFVTKAATCKFQWTYLNGINTIHVVMDPVHSTSSCLFVLFDFILYVPS